MPNALERKQTVISDIYLRYPYKWYDTSKSTIPFPYFSKREITDHEFTLSYKEYREIIEEYCKLASQEMLSGEEFKIPRSLGTIQLRKRKRACKKDFINWKKTARTRVITCFPRTHKYNQFTIVTKWYRKENKFKYKYLWRFKPTICAFKKHVGKVVNTDNSFINKLLDV